MSVGIKRNLYRKALFLFGLIVTVALCILFGLSATLADATKTSSDKKGVVPVFSTYEDSLTFSLIETGRDYAKASKMDSADIVLHQAALYLKKGSLLEADWYDIKAVVTMGKGDFATAIGYCQQALGLYHLLGETARPYEIKTLNNLGKAYLQINQLDSALIIYNQSLDLLRKIPQDKIDTMVLSNIYNNLGALYFYENKLDSALRYYDLGRTIAIMHYDERHPYVGRALYNIGLVRETKGYYTDAIYFYEQALDIYKQAYGETHYLIAEAYGGLGSAYLNRNEAERAIYYFEKDMSTVLAVYGSDHPDMAWGYESIGWAYLKLQQPEKAIPQIEKSLAIRQKTYGNIHTEIVSNLLLLAEAYADPAKSIPLAKKALETEFAVTKVPTFRKADAYLLLSDLHLQERNIHNAMSMSDAAIDILNQLVSDGRHPKLAGAMLKKSSLFLEQNNPEMAYIWADKAIDATLEPYFTRNTGQDVDIEHILFEQEYLQSIITKTTIFRKYFDLTKDPVYLQQCVQLCRKALPIIQKLQYLQTSEDAGPATDTLFSNLYQVGLRAAIDLYQLTGREKYQEEVFLFAEHLKNKSLSETVRSLDLYQVANIPESTMRREYQLKKDILYYRSQLESPGALPDREVREKLQSLYQEQERFNNNIRRYHPEYFKVKYAFQPVSLTHLQKEVLEEGDGMVHFSSTDSTFIAFFITKDQITLQEYSFKKWNAEKYFTSLMNAFGCKTMVVIPDVFMKQFYPESLRINGRFLIEQTAFIYNSSATLFARKPNENNVLGREVLVFAPVHFKGQQLPDLTFSEEEVNKIQTYLKIKPYVKDRATVKTFLKEVTKYSAIHLATHAKMNKENPLKSALFFHPLDTLHDGVLYAHDLFGQPMRAQLVSLSACHTAEQSGLLEETSGIAAAFAYNGCRNILMSLWEVEDKASMEIMSGFYKHLSNGSDKATALQQAKIDYLLQADKYRKDPKFWAGIILAGDYAPFNLGLNQWAVRWWIPALLALIIALLYSSKWWVKLTV